MVIRKGESPILRGRPRNICNPTSSNSGMLHVKKKLYRYITAKRFSNPHTNFGIDAQGALELGLPQITN